MRLDPGPTLRFPPGTRARRIRISLATGDDPESFQLRPVKVGSVTATAGRQPTDVVLSTPDGAVAWASPGELPPNAPKMSADLSVPLRSALAAALAAAGPAGALTTMFTMTGAAGSQVQFDLGPARGALVRRLTGVHTTVLRGEPAVPDGVPTLSSEQPTSVTADLTVRYDGIRLHPGLSDEPPSGPDGVAGVVVRDQPVLRPFPPAGPGPLPIACVGLVGRPVSDTELTIAIIGYDGDRPGAPIGTATTVAVPAGMRIGTLWVPMPPDVGRAGVDGGRLALELRASSGAFLWAAAEHPLAMFAVHDAHPPKTLLALGPHTLCQVDETGLHLPATALPAAAFTGSPPALGCELFVHVDLSDIELRYGR